MTEKNFEDIFKDKLSHFEADVNPSVWQSVQSGLAGKGAAVSGASGASQAAGTFAGLGAKGMLWIAAAALVTGAGLYYVWGDRSPASSEKVTAGQTNQVSVPAETAVTENQQPVTTVPENHAIDETQAEQKAVVKQAPALAGNKSQQTSTYKAPEVSAAPPAAVMADNPKREEPTVTPVKTSESRVEEKSIHDAVPSIATEKSAEPSAEMFDQIEKYLLVTSTGVAALPNNFTPDGDGYNDVFTLHTTGLKSLEVTIFSQDAVVAKWNDLNGSWNGLLPGGKIAKAGTYYYSVKAVTEEGKICIAQSTLILAR